MLLPAGSAWRRRRVEGVGHIYTASWTRVVVDRARTRTGGDGHLGSPRRRRDGFRSSQLAKRISVFTVGMCAMAHAEQSDVTELVHKNHKFTRCVLTYVSYCAPGRSCVQ